MKKNTTVDITPMSDAELDGVLGARREGWVVVKAGLSPSPRIAMPTPR